MTETLIRRAFDDPGLAIYRETPGLSRTGLQVYIVRLSFDRYPGVAPDWYVAMPDADATRDRTRVTAALFDFVREISAQRGSSRSSSYPVLVLPQQLDGDVISDIARSPYWIFSASPTYLSEKSEGSHQDETFFARALRAKVWNWASMIDIGSISPFKGREPPERWRFYGRERELRQILQSAENILVVGGRRTGKTSLMLAAQDELRNAGIETLFSDCSDCVNAGALAVRIIGKIDTRESSRYYRHATISHERPLELALRSLEKRGGRVVLFLDEIGTAVKGREPDNWKMFGVLRHYSQRGVVRLVMSCFDEVFQEQLRAYDSPLNNFASVIRIGYFSDAECDAFLFSSLRTWRHIDAHHAQKLKEMIASSIGRHPYLLQAFAAAFFNELIRSPSTNVVDLARKYLFGEEYLPTFSSVVTEMWERIPSGSALIKALFLTRCRDCIAARQSPADAIIDDDYVDAFVQTLNYSSTYECRRYILECLELYGLSGAVAMDRTRQRIGVPILFNYMEATTHNFPEMIKKLRQSIGYESVRWGLIPLERQE